MSFLDTPESPLALPAPCEDAARQEEALTKHQICWQID